MSFVVYYEVPESPGWLDRSEIGHSLSLAVANTFCSMFYFSYRSVSRFIKLPCFRVELETYRCLFHYQDWVGTSWEQEDGLQRSALFFLKHLKCESVMKRRRRLL